MLSKEERKEFNNYFWGKFKTYSNKQKGADGRRKNWASYPTNVKQVFIRLTVDDRTARFSIEIQDKDDEIRDLVWEQFTELKKVLEDEMLTPGIWEKEAMNVARQPIGRISWILEDVSMYKEEDHQKIFEFFLQHLVRFDQFYNTYNEILYALLK